MGNKLKPFGYDRENLSAGILHIGVGNFHRAHEEYYTNLLLADTPSASGWAIKGAMLMPGDEALYKSLKAQKGLYTLTICGRDGHNEAVEIGSLIDLMWIGENPQAILNTIADPAIRIISLTITEGGYNIDSNTGEFNLNDEGVKHDLADPANPRTVFGIVAEGLRRRMAADAGAVTILTCDNLQHNGDTARKAFTSFFKAQDPTLAAWVEKNVTFPNSMVDRITPATHPADVERLNAMNGTHDKAPVYCEDFIQWVIEDKFANGRPQWERVGVEFTDDVTAFENMKLSLLNASHTLLSYPSFLMGYRKVDEAMKDPLIERLVKDFMDTDITPYVPAPGTINLEDYKQTLIERFGNAAVSDQVARLCFDGLSKFPVYVTPNLTKMVRDGKELKRLAFLIAAYRHYLKYEVDDCGNHYDVAEPRMTPETAALVNSDNPIDFLDAEAFAGAGLKDSAAFKADYLKYVDEIKSAGVKSLLESMQN